MRTLREFSIPEWFKLIPLRDYLKQKRNDLVLSRYLAKQADGEQLFLENNRHLHNKAVGLIIAFEQPLALDWLLGASFTHLNNCSLVVFDNSRRLDVRLEIESICRKHNTAYLQLPPNTTKHVNRSHSLAMSWVYEHFVQKIEPKYFGYIDHDMIPIKALDVNDRLENLDCYGVLNSGFDSWNLWAGYCFYRYSAAKPIRMNFMYDFSRGLDTGGRNWAYYRNLSASAVKFATSEFLNIKLPASGESRLVQVIDNNWIHIGGIGYNENFAPKKLFFEELNAALANGTTWDQLIISSKTIK